ncbi:zinc finger protein 420-like [Phlebotomus argentipes]|uniref:zinc finger protein 420-like n=1 Tax=Phlebotomus argentipes TaxID=94469 RepID=UPI002892E9ED|nr:zinc finger protein 420-like [Phlebotomus argentipes]
MYRKDAIGETSWRNSALDGYLGQQGVIELCRICEETEDLVDISTEEFSHLNEKLHQIADFEDTYSTWLQFICVTCSMKLENAFDFKSQCEFTYRKLLSQMRNTDQRSDAADPAGDADDDLEVENEQIYFEELKVMKHPQQLGETINLDSDSSDWGDFEESEKFHRWTEMRESAKDMETLPIECDVSVSSDEEVMANVGVAEIADEPNGAFVCSMCDKSFKGRAELRDHIDGVHHNSKRHECNVCGAKYTHYVSMMRHRKMHSAETFPCDFCGKAFRTKTYMKSHRKVHMVSFGSKAQSLECQICGHKSQNTLQHMKHVKIHNGEKPHKCEECGKSFLRKQYLNEHYRMHTGERPFPCHICSYAFRYRTHLSRHLKTHTGEKSYKCLECGKSFMQSGTLTIHMRIHTGEYPFECSSCPKKFREKREFTKHREKCFKIKSATGVL